MPGPFGRGRRRARQQGWPSYQVTEVIGSSVDLDDAIEAAALRLAARRRAERASRRGDLVGMAFMGMVAAAAYAAVRALMDRDSRELLDLPAPFGPLAASVADDLRKARAKVREGIVESRRAADEARRELESEYLERTGRDADA